MQLIKSARNVCPVCRMDRNEVDRIIKGLMLKDLRVQCRARGLSPAGGKEQLSERLAENMIATQDLCVAKPPC